MGGGAAFLTAGFVVGGNVESSFALDMDAFMNAEVRKMKGRGDHGGGGGDYLRTCAFEASTLSTLYGSYVEGEEGTPKLKIKIYRKDQKLCNKIPRYMYKPPPKVPPKNKQTATHYITRKTLNIL